MASWFVILDAVAVEYPLQPLTREVSVRFGMDEAAVEKLLNKQTEPSRSPVARKGKDTTIVTPCGILNFDSGRLDDMAFNSDFDFSLGLAPFKVAWKNITPVGQLSIASGMTKQKCLAYLSAWETRAKQLGAVRIESNRLLREGEYSRHDSVEDFIDTIHFSFGPERSARGGESWGDGITLSFVAPRTAQLYQQAAGALEQVSFFCDEFSTMARRTPTPPEHSFPVPVLTPVKQPATFDTEFVHPDRGPTIVTGANPQYPLDMRRAGIPGKAMIFFVVEVDGTTSQVQCTEANDREFAESAIAAVQKWKFRPAELNGKPVRAQMSVPVLFNLDTIDKRPGKK